jgi:tetratricopeptide (TPR) repeat protein
VPPEVSLHECEPAVVQAIETARRQVIEAPRSGAAWGKLGQVLLAHDFTHAAAPCFVQAARFDPDNPRWPYYRGVLLLRRDGEAAVPPLRLAAELCAAHDPDNLTPRLRLAEALMQQERPAEAAAEFQAVLQRQPHNPRAHYGLGLAAAASGDLEGARRHLQSCASSPLARKKAMAELARVLMRQGDSAGAAAASKRAQELPPDEGWLDRYASEFSALAADRQGRFLWAKELLQRGQTADAVALLRRLAEEKPDYRAYLDLGKALIQSGDTRAAHEALREAARIDPDRFDAAYLLSVLLVDLAERSLGQEAHKPRALEQLREAAECGRRAVALKPEHALAHLYLGRALKGLGERPRALESLRTAVRLAPQRPDAYLYLGETLAEDGNKDEAGRMLEQAARLARPDDPRPRQALERLRRASARP